jgi:hypothetical protein
MKPAVLLALVALSACSTVESRMDAPPLFSFETPLSVAAFNECFVRATAGENVNYLPRERGGTFKASAGPQDYVFWLVTIEDLGSDRRASVQAVNSAMGRKAAAKVQSCIG